MQFTCKSQNNILNLFSKKIIAWDRILAMKLKFNRKTKKLLIFIASNLICFLLCTKCMLICLSWITDKNDGQIQSYIIVMSSFVVLGSVQVSSGLQVMIESKQFYVKLSAKTSSMISLIIIIMLFMRKPEKDWDGRKSEFVILITCLAAIIITKLCILLKFSLNIHKSRGFRAVKSKYQSTKV